MSQGMQTSNYIAPHIQLCPALPNHPTTLACIARLWREVCSNRHLTHYGEEHCRLDRTTPLYGGSMARHSRILGAISRVLFHIPEAMNGEMEKLFVDGLVWQNQWRTFVKRLLADWKQSVKWSFALLLSAHLICPCLLATNLLLQCTSIDHFDHVLASSRKRVHFDIHLQHSCWNDAPSPLPLSWGNGRR
jgi:hypothetical protein